ncbi:diguanylate cyclase (GGDEF) domain [Thiomonas bhubaneswarensis]|uniref:diguanylate cyclase n=2 Tax=Thiomonas bhubaneswarensis TaxID=339866 RepID=A0A0K6IBN1_9BURK|nr:diguanylate cyclase (GGDEF) domain [Thiomonas bhubaneswarensis]
MEPSAGLERLAAPLSMTEAKTPPQTAADTRAEWRLGWDGLFADAAQEETFVREEWTVIGPRVRQIGLYGSLAFLSATFTDLTVLGATWVYWSLLTARFGILAWGLWLARVGKARTVPNVRRVATALLGFELSIMALFLLVVLAYGGSADYHSITALALIFAGYAYVPVLRREAMWVGGLFTLLFAVVIWTSLHYDAKFISIAVVLFGFANIAGWQIAVSLSRSMRLAWVDRQRLRVEAEAAQQAKHMAEQSEENLQRLFDAAPMPLVLVRMADARVLRFNAAAKALIDPDGALQGDIYSTDFYENPAQRDQLIARLQAEDAVGQVEVRLKTVRGTAVDVLFSMRKVRFAGEDCVITGMVEISAQKSLERQLRALAFTDPLTGLQNRRGFFTLVERAMAQSALDSVGPCVVLIDIDHFKRINDRYGHPVGDEVLVQFGQVVLALLRDGDVFARLGGEEFCILLPHTRAAQALEVAERVREFVAAHPFQTMAGVVRLSLSLGVAGCDAPVQSIDAVLSMADQAMYRAKQGGRNRTELHCA